MATASVPQNPAPSSSSMPLLPITLTAMDSQFPEDPSQTPPTSLPPAQSSPPPLSPADNSAYTTEELTTLFSSLETRLSGYVESLLGVAQCLDSLQTQIKALQRERRRESSDAASDREEKHAADPKEWENEGQNSSGEGVGGIEEMEWRDEGGVKGREGEGRPEGGGDGEVNNGDWGNLVSGFVFGDDDAGKS